MNCETPHNPSTGRVSFAAQFTVPDMKGTFSSLRSREHLTPSVGRQETFFGSNSNLNTQIQDKVIHPSSSGKQTRVISLPWTDPRGSVAEYTGMVNSLIQPHGRGLLKYKNGKSVECTWCNGMMVRPMVASVVETFTVDGSGAKNRVLQLGDSALPNEIAPPSPPSTFNPQHFPLHSFAFIKRSTGVWTYAIVADRPIPDGPDASIRFVVDVKGSTKVFKKKHWERYIRLVNDDLNSSPICEGSEVNNNELSKKISEYTKKAMEVEMMSIRTDRVFY